MAIGLPLLRCVHRIVCLPWGYEMKSLRLFLVVAAAWLLLVVSVQADTPPPGFKNTGIPGGGLMGEIPGTTASFSFNGVFTPGDLVLCEDTSCAATVDANGAVTAYTGNVSDVVQFRPDPNDPNSTLVTMYSEIDAGSEGVLNNDVFNYPLGATNFTFRQEAPLTPNGPTGTPAEQTFYNLPGANFSWTFVSDVTSPAPPPVPEPSSLLLLGSGLLGLSGVLRKFRS